MKNIRFKLLLIVIVVLVNMGCDQATKELARVHLKSQGTVQVIGDFFVMRYAENRGAFLGMGSSLSKPLHKLFLIVIPAIMLVVCCVYIIKKDELSRLELIALASVVGGGLSNLIDRILCDGAVTDFLNFGIGKLRTGILNVADLSITFGVFAFLVVYYIQKKRGALPS